MPKMRQEVTSRTRDRFKQLIVSSIVTLAAVDRFMRFKMRKRHGRDRRDESV